MMKLKKGTTGLLLFVTFLALFMVLSLPGISFTSAISETAETETLESDLSNRSPRVIMRLISPHLKYLIIDRSPFPLVTIPISAIFLLSAPWVHFRPSYSLFMKRLLLLPIKFTSKFVSYQPN
ncbi:hypothetical protein J2T12_005548 [Paenibacillus anaericanus]|nr:hypothetical protein [Paenibacillus anaericanus]